MVSYRLSKACFLSSECTTDPRKDRVEDMRIIGLVPAAQEIVWDIWEWTRPIQGFGIPGATLTALRMQSVAAL